MTKQLSARAGVLFLVFVVLGIYYPAIFAPINSVDDPGTINYLLNSDSFSLKEIFTPGGNYFRPILLLSFMADKFVFGLQESFMHLENILFHLVNVLLLFFVARRGFQLNRVDSWTAPLLTALVFAVHPINTESVNWISGRTDPLACMFLLLSALVLLRPATSVPTSLAGALLMLTACLAKETSIFFLPAGVLLPFFLPEEQRAPLVATVRRNWQHLLVFCTAGIGFFAFRSMASHHGDAGVHHVLKSVGGAESAGAGPSLVIPLKAAGFYLKKLLQPYPLSFGIIRVSDLYLWVGVAVCLIVLWLLLRRSLSAYFFLCAASVAGSALMIPLLNLTWTPLAERYMYIPCAFFVTGCALVLHDWQKNERLRPWFATLVAAVTLVFAWGTATRTLLWQDNLALFQDTLKKDPSFVPAQNEIAVALFARGRNEEARAMVKAMQSSSSLVNHQYVLINKAAALAQTGDLDGALANLQDALKDPGKHEVKICNSLLAVYQMKIEKAKGNPGAYGDSARLLGRLYELTGDPFYLYRRGLVYMAQKERVLARESFQAAAEKAPAGAVYREPSMKLAQKMLN
jgi:tetratricopeptide (TPR) repeat protein